MLKGYIILVEKVDPSIYKYINYFKICVCCKQDLIVIPKIKFESMLALSITTLLR